MIELVAGAADTGFELHFGVNLDHVLGVLRIDLVVVVLVEFVGLHQVVLVVGMAAERIVSGFVYPCEDHYAFETDLVLDQPTAADMVVVRAAATLVPD